jgi:protein-S-isoprenylcysteine O-methyltransferase Ste14
VNRSLPGEGVLWQLGDFFFRWRSYLPLLLVPVIVVTVARWRFTFGSEATDLAWECGCVLLALCGQALRAMTVGFAAPGTSGRNTREQKAVSLNTTGAYSVVRHPLYLGNSIIVIGLALFPHSWLLPLVATLVTTAYYACIAAREESFLRQRFGETFETWAARVPVVVPAVWRYVPSSRPFAWRTVVRREFYGLTIVLVAPFFLDMLEDLDETGVMTLEPVWTVTALIGALLFVIVRFLKKRTSVLS